MSQAHSTSLLILHKFGDRSIIRWYLSLENTPMQKIKDINTIFPSMLIMKESYIVTGWEYFGITCEANAKTLRKTGYKHIDGLSCGQAWINWTSKFKKENGPFINPERLCPIFFYIWDTESPPKIVKSFIFSKKLFSLLKL